MSQAAPTAHGDNGAGLDLVAMALAPLLLAATDASRGSLLAVAMALCLLLTGGAMRLLRPLAPGALVLPLALLLCCAIAFLLRVAALICCYELAQEMYHVLPLVAASNAIIFLVNDSDSDMRISVPRSAALALALLLATGIMRGLLAHGAIYVPPGDVTADGPLPIFATAPGAFILLAALLAGWRLWLHLAKSRTTEGEAA